MSCATKLVGRAFFEAKTPTQYMNCYLVLTLPSPKGQMKFRHIIMLKFSASSITPAIINLSINLAKLPSE